MCFLLLLPFCSVDRHDSFTYSLWSNNIPQLHNAHQLAEWCMSYLCVNYNIICKSLPKSLRALHPDNQDYLKENRWPPVWYLKDFDYYQRCMNEINREGKHRGKAYDDDDDDGCLCFSGGKCNPITRIVCMCVSCPHCYSVKMKTKWVLNERCFFCRRIILTLFTSPSSLPKKFQLHLLYQTI